MRFLVPPLTAQNLHAETPKNILQETPVRIWG
jgi:hypothetical protein